ncbi:MAG: serine hydrolase domain-containing protein [Balneola sp.]
MKKLLLLLLYIALPPQLFSQDLSLAIHKADSISQEFYTKYSLPGLSISVYKGDGVIWSKGYGYADVENKIPVSPSETLFRIGSVSKTITAAGMGVLIQNNKIDPKKEIQEYVPDFPEKKYPITVKQVAGHIAGIRSYKGDEFMNTKKFTTVTEGLKFFKDDSLLFEPGTQYQYSSYGWNLISAVIEGASNEAFLPFMKREVFEPLGMDNTVPDWADQDIKNRAKFYIWRNGTNIEAPYVDNSYKWAGGGFIGTTEDMIRFGKAHLDYDFLDEETQKILMFPQSLNDGKDTNYGMGWSGFKDSSTGYWVGHTGGSVGGTTMFLISKEHRMVIAYTINRSGAEFDNLHFKVAKVFLAE